MVETAAALSNRLKERIVELVDPEILVGDQNRRPMLSRI